MGLTILKAADRQARPWKNGGGSTREIAVHPIGAGFDDFEWRVSTARVSANGPFSCFQGVDRTLLLLEGSSLRLTIGQAITTLLTAGSTPFTFPADVPVDACLSAGKIVDLNVMVRRDRWAAEVERVEVDAPLDIRRGPATCIVLALDACVASNGGEDIPLGAGDAVHLGPDEVVELLPGPEPARIVVIALSRAG